jgi:hypothetical protein
MGEFLTFQKMITPIVIQIIFWILVVVVVIAGIVALFSGGIQGVLTGLVMIILGPVIVRIYCELIILWFRIYEQLNDIKQNTQKS